MEKATQSTFLPLDGRGSHAEKTCLYRTRLSGTGAGRRDTQVSPALDRNLFTLCTAVMSLMISRGVKQSQLTVTISHVESSENEQRARNTTAEKMIKRQTEGLKGLRAH